MWPKRFIPAVLALTFAVSLWGCSRPNAANIELRKKNQVLTEKVEELYRRHAADLATMRALQDRSTTQPVVEIDRLQRVVTVAGIKIKPMTGPTMFDASSVSDDGFKVYLVPIDQAGDDIKAFGSIDIEAFDLQSTSSPLFGQWHFTLDDARKNWFGKGLLYEFILPCRWKQTPDHEALTIKVTYIDELTGRKFDEQKVIKIKLPPRTETSAMP